MTLICAVIAADTQGAAKVAAAQALMCGAEAFEVRIDALLAVPEDLSFLPIAKPVIVTFRSEMDGERREIFAAALDAGATYVDIESSSVLRDRFPRDRVICSYHDFGRTPAMQEILSIFQDLSASGIPKAAFMVRGPADLWEIWKSALVLKQSGEPFILIGMGVAGEITRIRATDIGSMVTYCTMRPEDASALGQITVVEAVRLGLDPLATAIIGWPLEHTRSPQIHNAAFLAAGIRGRYVRIPVPEHELPLVPAVFRCYRIAGANVTIPHKQAIIPHLSKLSPKAHAAGTVNTICVGTDGTLTGTNTDLVGIAAALAALGNDPAGKRALIVGAGGAARAAAACLISAGAKLFVTNRTTEKAAVLAAEFGAVAVPLDALRPEYDLVINATPAGMSGFSAEIPVPVSILSPDTAVFDMVYEPETTPLLSASRSAGVRVAVGGKSMLIEQAAASFALWARKDADRTAMTKAFGGQP
ncbi:MAG: shikimate dehydrogenase [Methanocalculaceae archaeon]|jgi:shikimate dehydrogenase/3-dehydroquinate dehydratase type I|nr:shikimate dehydrogenase [Methanocalculaceae archaeon]